MNIYPRVISALDVSVSTTSKVIAYEGDDNVLTFSINKPHTKLDPTGDGTIKLYMPTWIEIDTTR